MGSSPTPSALEGELELIGTSFRFPEHNDGSRMDLKFPFVNGE